MPNAHGGLRQCQLDYDRQGRKPAIQDCALNGQEVGRTATGEDPAAGGGGPSSEQTPKAEALRTIIGSDRGRRARLRPPERTGPMLSS
jgi:hypothetical protein